MTEGKKTFWSNLPALITAITGLIVAMVTVFQLIQPSGSSDSPQVQPKFNTAEKIPDIGEKINPNQIAHLITLQEGDDYWAKEGYYLEFDNAFRIWPSNIKSGSAIIRITDKNNKEVKASKLMSGQEFRFKSNNKTYLISLVKIGRAGKNPFSKAAFFKVQMSNK